MKYVKIVFTLRDAHDAEIIMALLAEFPWLGYEQMDTQLLAYCNEDVFDEIVLKELLGDFVCSYSFETIAHENWNQVWESNFEPIRVGNDIGVRASFHEALVDCKYEIVITPKMSFGTGHHETTQMMLEYIGEIDCRQKSVFDFGCGTGVLAILAKMKGANKIVGIDNDAWSVENAIENCRNNHASDIEISIQDIREIHQTFDIILANINLNILLEHLPQMKALLHEGGLIIMSGIFVSDIPQLKNKFELLGMQQVSTKQKKDWAAVCVN
ncbi:MAG: 50S ribosomal protein L11 methyltransferase [Bacteroidetes bacterium]|nr:50S ribosomal protein L11 methyltransferase [Bacteroidota bacterium]